MQFLPPAFQALSAYHQFVTWFAAPDEARPGKMNKFPCNAFTGAVVGSVSPEHWVDVKTALAHATRWDRGYGAGIGFCFTAQDPFFFLDIDKCLQDDGQWSPLALQLCGAFAGCAIEVSHSGRGLHIIGTTAKPLLHGTRNVQLGLEFYTEKRFVALTGAGAMGDAGHGAQGLLASFLPAYFPQTTAEVNTASWTTEPVAEWEGPTDDQELINRMIGAWSRRPDAQFGKTSKLISLWYGERVEGQHSEEDSMMAGELAFWTGKNCERIERLMRMSGLVREKWDAPGHASYLAATIIKACGFRREVLKGRDLVKAPSPAVESSPGTEDATRPASPAGAVPTNLILYVGNFPEYFDGCVFVERQNAIYDTKNQRLLERGAFDFYFGRRSFYYKLDGTKPTDSAWEAFQKAQNWQPPSVLDMMFRPDLPQNVVFDEGNGRYLNSFIPYVPAARQGDPTPFLTHMAKILPDERDRGLFVSYLAAMAQNPGVKFQWWPVLQGTPGNGKSLLTELLLHIAGIDYVEEPSMAAMARDGLKFNSWMERCLLAVLEEADLGSSNRNLMEELKRFVTNPRGPLEKKGVDLRKIRIFFNAVIFTNHADGVPKTDDDRRYGVFMTAQQDPEDLTRDGMDSVYFDKLRAWLRSGGCEIVTDYLQRVAIPEEWHPMIGCPRAPVTSTTPEVIAQSRGKIEDFIFEAVAENRVGFMGGWVSSWAIKMLLKEERMSLAPKRYSKMMRSLGYVWHPALKDGRSSSKVLPDNAQSTLYIKKGHPILQVTDASRISKAYSEAQTDHQGQENAAQAAFKPRMVLVAPPPPKA